MLAKTWFSKLCFIPAFIAMTVGVGCINVKMRIPFQSTKQHETLSQQHVCILTLGVLTSRASSPVTKEKCKGSKIRSHVYTTLSTSTTTWCNFGKNTQNNNCIISVLQNWKYAFMLFATPRFTADWRLIFRQIFAWRSAFDRAWNVELQKA